MFCSCFQRLQSHSYGSSRLLSSGRRWRMKTPATVPVAAILASICAVAWAGGAEAGQFFLHRVSKGRHHGYVAGGTHVAPRSAPRPKRAFMTALMESTTVAIESGDASRSQMLRFHGRMLQWRRPRWQKHLKSDIDKAEALLIASFDAAGSTGGTLRPVLRLAGGLARRHVVRPWALGMFVMALGVHAAGLVREAAPEAFVLEHAHAMGSGLVALEGTAQQTQRLVKMTRAEQKAMLRFSLSEYERFRAGGLHGEIRLLDQGDVETYMASRRSGFTEVSGEIDFWDTLVTRRNPGMAQRIAQQILQGEVIFAIPGALHLPGSDGVLAHLKRMGFEITDI